MNLKARFKPRAEAGLLSQLAQDAWTDLQNRIASPERQAEVAERIASYFETLIPPTDFEVLVRYNRIAYEERCDVRVYDAEAEDIARYKEVFGIALPRKVPVLGQGGCGYPTLHGISSSAHPSDLPELDGYFLELLKARKQYRSEYETSVRWPIEYGKANGGTYPTWGQIAERFPVLGEWIEKLNRKANP